MSNTISELFVSLGLKVDETAFNVGKAALLQIQNDMQKLAVAAEVARVRGLGLGMDVGKALGTIGFPATTKLTTGMERLAKVGKFTTSAFQKMAVAAGSFFTLSKIKDMVKGVTDTGGKINDTAQQIGISAQSLQQWGHAAKLNGSSIDGFSTSAKKLAKNLYDISTGKGEEARAAFRKLGISLDEPAIKAGDTDKVFMLLSSRLSAMPDGAQKTALAMVLMGKSGSEMIPTLNQGVAALQGLRQEAIDTGLAMSDKDVTGLDDFGDQLQNAEDAMQGLKNQAVAAMLPALKQLVAGFILWVKANKDLVRTSVASAVRILISALRTFGTVVAFVVDHWRVFAALLAAGTVVSALLGIIKTIVFFQTVAVAAAVRTAIAWLTMMAPVVLLAVLITALGVLIYKYRDRVRAALRSVGSFFTNLGRTVKSMAETTVAWFVSVGAGIKKAITDAIDYAIDRVESFARKIRNLPGIKQLGDAGEYLLGSPVGASAFSAFKAGGTNAFDAMPDRTSDATTPRFAGAQQGNGTTRAAANPTNTANATTNYQLNINAANANAQDVARMVELKIKEQQERQNRTLAANVGL